MRGKALERVRCFMFKGLEIVNISVNIDKKAIFVNNFIALLKKTGKMWLKSEIKLMLFLIAFTIGSSFSAFSSQNSVDSPKKVYQLEVSEKTINITGTNKQALVINNSLPAPTLVFNKGDQAVIYVKNNLKIETSVHWHGILLPNFEDGVPYLTSPPILPGKTHKFEFLIDQSPGTYWYHSHTGLQEQEGLYGAFIIKDGNKQKFEDLVLVLSDWTDEKSSEVMRNLRRGNEWYAIKKGTALSLFDLLKNKALLAQLNMWRQRMPGMDISDVYYSAFLVNGKQKVSYPQLKGQVRLRVVNASASTYFWLTFGKQGKTQLVAADGMPVKATPVDKILHAIGETYDFIIDIPSDKAIEFKATAQDGSGLAVAVLGQGDLLKAPSIEKPDPIQFIKDMAQHDHSSSQASSSLDKRQTPSTTQDETKNHKHEMAQQSHSSHKHEMAQQGHSSHKHGMAQQSHSSHKNGMMQHEFPSSTPHAHHPKSHLSHKKPIAQHYNHLVSKENTSFSKKLKLKEIPMNLTGNMWRYVWSINGKVLSEVDKIKIHKGEVLRLILNNKTMMHHPMHLHGHFFRVINSHGDYSPLKHTVDVPPMSQVLIEFEPFVEGDWFFHCHVLYHMKSGMSRVFKYGNQRDSRLKNYPEKRVLKADRQRLYWGELDIMTHRLNVSATSSHPKEEWNVNTVFSWFDTHYKKQRELSVEASYDYFLSDFFRGSVAFEVENNKTGQLKTTEDLKFLGKLGFKYLLPYFFDFSFYLNHELDLQLEMEYELLLFNRVEFFTEAEIELHQFKNISQEWELGINYIMSQKTSLVGSYSNRFGWGAGFHLLL